MKKIYIGAAAAIAALFSINETDAQTVVCPVKNYQQKDALPTNISDSTRQILAYGKQPKGSIYKNTGGIPPKVYGENFARFNYKNKIKAKRK